MDAREFFREFTDHSHERVPQLYLRNPDGTIRNAITTTITPSTTCDRTAPLVGASKLDRFVKFIISHENATMNPLLKNPKSTAFGIGQLLLATRKAIASQLGYDPNTTNPEQQIDMMLKYIEQRYHSTEAAYKFWQNHGWY